MVYLMMRRHLRLCKPSPPLNNNWPRKYDFCQDYSKLLKGGNLTLDEKARITQDLLKKHNFTDVMSALIYVFGPLFKPVKASYTNTLQAQVKNYNDDVGSVLSHQTYGQKELMTNISRNIMKPEKIIVAKPTIGALFTEKTPGLNVSLEGTSSKFKAVIIWGEFSPSVAAITSLPPVTFDITTESWWAATMVYRRGSVDQNDCKEIYIAPEWPIHAETFNCYLRTQTDLGSIDNNLISS
jgi:hypothetical protein